MTGKMLKTWLIVLAMGAAGAYGWWYVHGRDEPRTRFRTARAETGEIRKTINATGTIEPEEVIDIGAQVLGMIKEFGRDPKNPRAFIDYGSQVEQGTVLARIDESLYRAAVNQAQANVHQAEANAHQAEANLAAMKSKLEQTKRDWERAQKLGPVRAITELDVDNVKNAHETAVAALRAGEAALEAAQKQVDVNRAALDTAKINLEYCTIVAPVKGVIVDRRVNIGQTVVASLSAPSLFLLAKDLTRLQVWASVNEADIGQIRAGQAVVFRVAAFPGDSFKGTVAQIRLNATMTQNVVTYTVVVSADNSSGRLLPYMTATLDFEVGRRASVLTVPNAALRWRPAPRQVAADYRAGFLRDANQAPGDSAAAAAAKAKPDTSHQAQVWVEDGEFVRPVQVRTGLSDGVVTEIIGGELPDGTAVVVGEIEVSSAPGAANPFAPQMPRPK
jgi:HlyD family secretion protein